MRWGGDPKGRRASSPTKVNGQTTTPASSADKAFVKTLRKLLLRHNLSHHRHHDHLISFTRRRHRHLCLPLARFDPDRIAEAPAVDRSTPRARTRLQLAIVIPRAPLVAEMTRKLSTSVSRGRAGIGWLSLEDFITRCRKAVKLALAMSTFPCMLALLRGCLHQCPSMSQREPAEENNLRQWVSRRHSYVCIYI